MISSLSNLADRNFVIGFLLPVIIATLTAAGVFQTVWPLSLVWSALGSSEGFEKLTIAALAMWSSAVLLMTINHPFYQFMEGYWGPFDFFKTFGDRQRAVFDAHVASQAELKRRGDAGDEEALSSYWEKEMDFHRIFPTERSYVLPTAFGNVLCALETYSLDVYGVDAIPGWLRLSGVIPESFQKQIDSARAEVDFFVNNCLLFAILTAVATAATAYSLIQWPQTPFNWTYLALATAAPLVSIVCYNAAVARAPDWGDLVRSAFDLYLPDLVNQLGYEMPRTNADRKGLMDALNGSFLLNWPVDSKFWKKKPAPPP